MKRIFLLIAAVPMILAGAAVPVVGAHCVLQGEQAEAWCQGFVDFVRGPAKIVFKPLLSTGAMPVDLLSAPLSAAGVGMALVWFFGRKAATEEDPEDPFNLGL